MAEISETKFEELIHPYLKVLESMIEISGASQVRQSLTEIQSRLKRRIEGVRKEVESGVTDRERAEVDCRDEIAYWVRYIQDNLLSSVDREALLKQMEGNHEKIREACTRILQVTALPPNY